jgi:hypothetical protein
MACPTFTKSKTFRISAAIVLLVILGGAAYGYYMFNLKRTDLSKVKPAYVISSNELFSAFDSDETGATAKFAGKVVEVSGNVAQVEFGSTDSTLSVTLREDDELSGVICTFSGVEDKSKLNISAGQKISVRGECSGMLMDVLLNNCVIVKE